ncbi:PREDICTED: uncharacterized protein LOC109158140 [Ipomoea nil]|uniref:uncharacterized protein LOC109158140 n=1 Tax=Ipomoea nil TaxID=35883 RepID=UPI0009012EFA|nr:PREDICTED: uncharacterized protein LOC109158140 [Ipomoea nil]
MVGSGRMKKVTDPLDDRVKARIVGRDPGEPGYVSSGSEHSEQGDGEESSPSFSDLLFCFADGDAGEGWPEEGSDEEGDLSAAWETGQAGEDPVGFGAAMMNNESDFFMRVLAVNVATAVEMYACLDSSKQILRRSVMGFLRGLGYNAAVCKTKWEGSGGLTAGNHEFIDVIRPDAAAAAARYLVDLDFAAEFQIARPTKHYERFVQSMPRIFVGKPDHLKQILKAVSDGARRSLKSRGLHIPPWRKHRFMQNKWLGSYKRTTNPLPSGNPPPLLPPSNQTLGIKCRSIGFDAAVNGRLLYPSATRTR